MMTQTIQRQYNEVIASHYDLDPQAVTGSTLDRAAEQIRRQGLLNNQEDRLRVYDVGMGTGMFLSRLKALSNSPIEPFGIDLSQKMIENASQKHPDLIAAVGDGANLDAHFPDQSFDVICTHFLSGFVPLTVLAPKVWSRLDEGGYWSFIGGTQAAFPTLQATANSKLLRWMFGGGRALNVSEVSCIPKGRDEIFQILESNGFVVREGETYEPALKFANMDEFLDFAYYGGWLTPFIEALGVHKTGAMTRFLLNKLFFPINDNHSIEIHLAQKIAK